MEDIQDGRALARREREREMSLSVTREMRNDGRASRDKHEQRLCTPSSTRVLCRYYMLRPP